MQQAVDGAQIEVVITPQEIVHGGGRCFPRPTVHIFRGFFLSQGYFFQPGKNAFLHFLCGGVGKGYAHDVGPRPRFTVCGRQSAAPVPALPCAVFSGKFSRR